jgi:hypothetical protein
MMNDDQFRRRMTVLRIIWGAMLMGEFAFLAITLVLRQSMNQEPDPAFAQTMLMVALAGLVIITAIGMFVRRSIFNSAADSNGQVPHSAYVTGSIIFWGACEAAALLGIVSILLTGQIIPNILVPAFAMALQVLNFPTTDKIRFD